MKRLFVFLLVAGLAWWWLGPRHQTVTLEQLATLPPPPTESGPGHSLQVIIPDTDMEYYTVSGGSVAEIREDANVAAVYLGRTKDDDAPRA